jgi:hypothetical protein
MLLSRQRKNQYLTLNLGPHHANHPPDTLQILEATAIESGKETGNETANETETASVSVNVNGTANGTVIHETGIVVTTHTTNTVAITTGELAIETTATRGTRVIPESPVTIETTGTETTEILETGTQETCEI